MSPEALMQEQTDVTHELYQAAIGAPSQAYYLRHFARFDAAGKTGISWNWAAFVSTLNWLIFRKMWGVACWYAGVSGVLVLAVFGIGKLVLHFSDETEWALILFFLLVSSLVPALFANAAYYRFCERKITRALVADVGVQGACELLARQASSARGAWALAGANLLGWALLVAAISWGGASPLVNPLGLFLAAPTPARPNATLAVVVPLERPPLPVAATASAPSPPASAVAALEVAAPAPPASAAPLIRASAIREAPPEVQSAKPAATYYIQVGAYAEKENARKVMLRLQAADLQAYRQLVSARRGALIQVRVGPFASRDDALAAAAKIKALDLPALLVKP